MKVIGFILILISYSSNVLGCNIAVDSVSNITFTWDGNEQSVTGTWQVSRDLSGDNECRDFHIAFTTGNSPDYNRYLMLQGGGSTNLDYNIYTKQNQNNILKDHPAALKSEVIEEKFKKKAVVKNGTFEVALAAPPTISSLVGGDYQDTVTMKVYKGDFNGTRVLATTEDVIVSITVPLDVELSIVDSGSTFIEGNKNRSIDFGEIDSNIKTENFDLLVQANASYTIKASSSNDGELAHSTSPSYKIPYSFYVNNVQQSLNGSSSTPIQIGAGSGSTSSPDGERFPLKVEISNSANTMSGVYVDSVQITVETNQ